MDMCDMYVWLHKHARLRGLGACSPRKFLEIRCSEMASEAILGQSQSRSSYMARRVLYPCNFWLSMYAFAKPAEIEFLREKVLRLGRTAGGTRRISRARLN